VRHTPPGGIVAVTVTAEAGSIVLQVKDTGEGIDPLDLPHIWERFYQARSERTPTTGAGLGLALVKELIEGMGGSVLVDSKVGEGSCFTIRLPQAHTDMPGVGHDSWTQTYGNPQLYTWLLQHRKITGPNEKS